MEAMGFSWPQGWTAELRRFAQSLRQRDDWRTHYVRKALRYSLLSLTVWSKQQQWLQLLDSCQAYRLAVQRDQRLLERWQHRSISLKFNAYRRLNIGLGHYQLLAKLLPEADLLQLYRDGSLSLAETVMKDGEVIRLTLGLPVVKGHEGELNLRLQTADDLILYVMTVSFDPNRDRLYIGCLQGPASEDGLARVKEVTRQCHGLRPKNLLLSAAYTLAAAAGLGRVLGVSNQSHAWSRREQVAACYDSFWQESGGQPQADGFYDLGAHEPARDVQAVASKRRAAFRQREALRAELMAQMKGCLLAQSRVQASDHHPRPAFIKQATA